MKYVRWFIVFLCGILVWGIFMRYYPNNFATKISNIFTKKDSLSYYQNKYARFEQIDTIFGEDYYYTDRIDSWEMVQSAIKAYVDSINDPYTVYMDAEENSGFMSDLEWENHFDGIWAVVSKKDYYVLVEEVIKNAPAFKAGIKPLDRIIKIDNDYIQDWTLDEAVKKMRWPAWSTVAITFERDNGEKTEMLKVEVTRDTIDIPSVSSKIFDIWDKKVWYIEISLIWEETEKLFKNTVNDLKKDWIEGIILDLRWNGGWYLDVWVQIASHFVPKWQLIVAARYRWYADTNYYSKWYGDLEWIKTVVLVDWLTASAGEIIALALQEQVWATLLWTTTFGKWTIQTIFPFVDWDSVKYTVWAWYPPSDKNINEVWVSPDIVVEFDVESYVNDSIDNQLEEAKNLFNK